MLDAAAFVRLTVEPIRLAILGAGATGAIDVDHIAAALGVPSRRVAREVGRLVGSGLIVDGRLDVGALRALAGTLPREEPAAGGVLDGPWDGEERKVLAAFFSGSRLASIPAQHAKRRVILERLAQEFEPGVRYTERQVDSTLRMFHADHAALRRHLVDEGLMTRADGVYWRSGGRT